MTLPIDKDFPMGNRKSKDVQIYLDWIRYISWLTVKGPYLSRGAFDKQATNKSMQLWFVMLPILWKAVLAIFVLLSFIILIRD